MLAPLLYDFSFKGLKTPTKGSVHNMYTQWVLVCPRPLYHHHIFYPDSHSILDRHSPWSTPLVGKSWIRPRRLCSTTLASRRARYYSLY